MLDWMDSGKLTYASTVALSLTPKGFERVYRNFDEYKNVSAAMVNHGFDILNDFSAADVMMV